MPIVVPGKRFSPRLQKSRIFGKGHHGKKGVFAELLITRLGVVVSRREILREAFGYDFEPGTNIVEVHVGHVRRKLAGSRLNIETVRGFGYRAREL